MDMVADFLPPWPRAARLCDLYLEQAPWFFGAVTRRQLVEEVLPLFYDEAVAYRDAEAGRPDPNALTSSAAAFNLAAPSPARADAPSQSSHDLALLLVVFCFGALTDADLLPAPHNTEADRYFRLARAALNAEPVLERPPSVATVQTLSLMGIYHGLVADEHSIESTWALMGLSSKLAQSVGLHRDCARWKLSPAEVQKRRALFWELFITDCWQALATGRLPTFSMPFVDTELPGDPDQTIAEDGSVQPSFPSWKARWGRECLAEVVQGTLTSRAPKYTVILELDRKLRDMPLPQYALGAPPKGTGLSQTMSHFMPINYLHLTLLYVHRCFFAQALADHPTDPLRSQYAPSFLAGYRSACALLSTVREQFTLFPVQIARFWVLWTHAFSSSVMLASVVTHGRTTKTAQAALGELRLACDLFEKAAEHGGRAVKFLPIVRRLHDKAYRAHTQGQPPRRDIFTPRAAADAQDDELSIFSGRTRTVATKSNKPPRPRSISRRRAAPGPGPAAPTPPDSQSGAGVGPLETFPSLESYGSSVHPVLADEMRAFQGALDAQISSINAYYLGAQQAAQYPPQPQYDAWYAMQEQDALAPPPAAMHFQQASELVPVPIPVQHAGEHLPQMPVYGAVDPGTVSEPQYYNYGVPVPPQGAADHGYQTHPPAHSELWQVPPGGGEAVFPGTSPEYRHLAGPAYQHAESGSRSQSQSRRESFTQSQQHQMMPPPAILPVRPGAYSLQETWTSFMQQELPTPVSQHPGFGRR
ncbi:hypothetical protein AcW1_002704 [Taiwanofungus camphoratus]|nr:hypothetical protein AcW1_002704 [Antrodia cinnamomea]